jgi:hypothetical protein
VIAENCHGLCFWNIRQWVRIPGKVFENLPGLKRIIFYYLTQCFAQSWSQCQCVLAKREEKNYSGTGVDVMITIFCDFQQFSAKKNWRFSQKTNVMIKFLNNLALL